MIVRNAVTGAGGEEQEERIKSYRIYQWYLHFLFSQKLCNGIRNIFTNLEKILYTEFLTYSPAKLCAKISKEIYLAAE